MVANKIYNPASTRIQERTTGKDIPGVVVLIFPDGWVQDLGYGRVAIAGVQQPAGGAFTTAFEPTQDNIDPRKFVIPGTDNWIASSIRIWVNGQKVRTSALFISGTGNRTIELPATFPAPDMAADIVEGEGSKA
jgi:hypothetical protein